MDTPRFDSKIPDAFRLYRGQGSNSEHSDGSDFSDSCTSCDDFSESYTNSEYGSSADDDEDASDSDVNSENNNSDSGSYPPDRNDEDTRTTSTSDKKDDDDGEEREHQELRPLQLVWAKSRGYPWYPALIIDPDIPQGFTHHSVPLPCPPQHVLDMRKKRNENEFLVLFFDAKRTWQWLPSSKLEMLGVRSKVDESKLIESKKPADRKAVKKAYEEALHYQSQVTKKRPEGKL